MRRRTALLFVLILGLVAALGTTPGLLGAQEGDGEGPPGEGIGPGPEGEGIAVDDLGRVGDGLNAYEFTFEPGAYIPEQTYEEAMVVKVLDGRFVFLNRDGAGVIVDPQGQEIIVVEAVPSIDPSPPESAPPTYPPTGDVIRDPNGDPCTTLCRIPRGTIAQIETGYTVYLPGGVRCFLCNTADFSAVLRVVAPAGFSWSTLPGISQAAPASPVARYWALDPGTHCH